MTRVVRERIEGGPFPYEDGWGWLYRWVERIAPAGHWGRRALCRYFYPNRLETWRSGLTFKLLGVPVFGSVIPTGGIVVRRLTKARMAPYTLTGSSVGAARDFYYRTCVFEGLHLPFFLILLTLALFRAMEGRWDLATENTVINLVVNLYPILHHRHTRTRIVQIVGRKALA